MSMHQYIGARYVPRFRGTYNNTTEYEALDVVDNGAGTSYISCIPTPPGTPLTDTTHWALYGASSGAIINLQNQIDDMNDGTIPGSLQNQINANKDNIDDLLVRNLNTRRKKILFIGDSYANKTDGTYRYAQKIASWLDCIYTEANGDGYGFTMANGVGTFQQLLESVTADRETYSDIVVCGGCNDEQSNVSDIMTAIYNFIESAETNFPNATVHIGMIGAFGNAASMKNILNVVLPAYRACGIYGAHYLGNVEYIMYNSNCFLSDQIHPNTGSVGNLAKYIAEALISGECDIELFTEATPTDPGDSNFNMITGSAQPMVSYMHNNRVGFMPKSGTQICSIHINNYAGCVTNNRFVQVVAKDLPQLYGFLKSDSRMGGIVTCKNQNNVMVMGRIYFSADNKMALDVYGLPNDTTDFTIAAVTQPECEFDILRY